MMDPHLLFYSSYQVRTTFGKTMMSVVNGFETHRVVNMPSRSTVVNVKRDLGFGSRVRLVGLLLQDV